MNKKSIFTLIIILLLVFVAGASKGLSDTLQFHYSQSIFSAGKYNQNYFNPDLSWKNKYQDYDHGDRSEAFPLSTTALVALTDAWHLSQMFQTLAWVLALLFSWRLGYEFYNNQRLSKLLAVFSLFVLVYLSFQIGFNLTYDWLLLI